MSCRIRQLEGRLLRSAMRMSPSASMRGSLRSSGSRSPSSSFSGGVDLHQQSHRLSLITFMRAAALCEVPSDRWHVLLLAVGWHGQRGDCPASYLCLTRRKAEYLLCNFSFCVYTVCLLLSLESLDGAL